MQSLVFDVKERTEKGKKVRAQGEVPAVIYGEALENPIPCQMTKKEMVKLLSQDSSVIALNLNGKTQNCVLKDVQRDVFGEIIHVDFQYVKQGDSVKLRIPIKFVGVGSLDSRKLLLDEVISEVQLQGHPDEIPEHIEVDVAGLNYGDHVCGKDLAIPANLKADIKADDIVARIGSLVSSEAGGEEAEEATE
ncbi:MAG: 50S ribosomal protein L25 [Intestinibacter sp.]